MLPYFPVWIKIPPCHSQPSKTTYIKIHVASSFYSNRFRHSVTTLSIEQAGKYEIFVHLYILIMAIVLNAILKTVNLFFLTVRNKVYFQFFFLNFIDYFTVVKTATIKLVDKYLDHTTGEHFIISGAGAHSCLT